VQQPTGIKGFATRPLGRIVLIAVAIVTLGFGVIYLSAIFGIAILLLFGLALPIYMGWKRPRGLALAGIVILLLAAPLTTVLVTYTYFQPPGAVGSPGENGGSFLQNASVTPFSSTDTGNFRFSVTLVPSYLYANSTLVNLTLFVSTCAEATIPNQTTDLCTTPFPSYQQVRAFNGTPDHTVQVTFNQTLSGPNLWWWNAYATYRNSTGVIQYIFLDSGTTYSDIQGPVVGSFLAVMGLVLVPAYALVLIYPGIGFYVALLVYTWFKAREARRKALEAAPAGAPAGGAGGTPMAAGTTPGKPAPVEQHCPKCNAVVYANESQCWKCGTPLKGASGSSPLPSGPSPPAS
jgi:hypothetical protein